MKLALLASRLHSSEIHYSALRSANPLLRNILGQGDNQVVVIRLPPEGQLQDLRMTPDSYGQLFVSRLHEVCSKMGMVLKPDETWVSTVLVEYAKRYYLWGAEVSSSLKRVARISNETNNGFPTLCSGVSSVFSAAVGVARCDSLPVCAYFIACVEAGCQVLSRMRATVGQLAAILLTPGSFGGLSIVPLSSMAVRGSMDPASEPLFLIRYIYSHYPPLYHEMSKIIVTEKGSGSLETILLDPFSLNLSLSRVSETWNRQMLEEHLPTIVISHDIRCLFSPQARLEKARLMQDLGCFVPFSPRVGNYILGLSNICIGERVLTKFTSSSSVRRVISQEMEYRESDFRRILSDADQLALDRIRLALRGPAVSLTMVQRGHNDECNLTAIQAYRDEVWGRQIHGVSMPDVTEQVRLCRKGQQTDTGSCIVIRVDDVEEGQTCLRLCRVEHPLYIGGRTKLRQKRSVLETVETHALSTSLRLVHQARTWVSAECTELSLLFATLHEEKTDIPESVIQEVSPTIVGGSVSHRLQDQASRLGALINSLLNFNSYCGWNSDSLIRFSKISLNYTICFQSIILSCLCKLSLLESFGADVSGVWLAEFSCNRCTVEVPSNVHDLSRALTYGGLPLARRIQSLMIHDRVTRKSCQQLEPAREMAAALGRYVGREVYHTSATSVSGLMTASTSSGHPLININLTELVRSDTEHLLGSVALHFLLAAGGDTRRVEDRMQTLVAYLRRSPVTVLVRNICEVGKLRLLCAKVGSSTVHIDAASIRTHFWIAESWMEGPSGFAQYLSLPPTVSQSEFR